MHDFPRQFFAACAHPNGSKTLPDFAAPPCICEIHFMTSQPATPTSTVIASGDYAFYTSLVWAKLNGDRTKSQMILSQKTKSQKRKVKCKKSKRIKVNWQEVKTDKSQNDKKVESEKSKQQKVNEAKSQKCKRSKVESQKDKSQK